MIERTASFASSTDGQMIGDLPSVKWCAPTYQEPPKEKEEENPSFLFRISGFSDGSTEELNSLQLHTESPQALGLKDKLLKMLCLR